MNTDENLNIEMNIDEIKYFTILWDSYHTKFPERITENNEYLSIVKKLTKGEIDDLDLDKLIELIEIMADIIHETNVDNYEDCGLPNGIHHLQDMPETIYCKRFYEYIYDFTFNSLIKDE
jgi:hypothetical protein